MFTEPRGCHGPAPRSPLASVLVPQAKELILCYSLGSPLTPGAKVPESFFCSRPTLRLFLLEFDTLGENFMAPFALYKKRNESVHDFIIDSVCLGFL